MVRRVPRVAVLIGVLLLTGCAAGFLGFAHREAWRAEAERACMSSRLVTLSDYIQRIREVDGNGTCGIDRPLRVAALSGGRVELGPDATLGCPITAAVERWLETAVQPAAMARFGSPVVEIKQMSAYACRPRNNVHGAELSEHAFGNALDVAAFKLADGREVTVLRGWRGSEAERAFLREVHAQACQQFNTVLGPGTGDGQHENHFHLDLAHHNGAGTSRYCRPNPVMPPPAIVAPGVPMAGLSPMPLPPIAARMPLPPVSVAAAVPVAVPTPGPVPPMSIPAALFR